MKKDMSMSDWELVPVGTDVILNTDDGTEILTRTRSKPWLLPNGHPVIMLAGFAGGWSLKRVRLADDGHGGSV